MNKHSQELVDKIRLLKQQGEKNGDISSMVGLSEYQVKSVCHQYGFMKKPGPGRLEVSVGGELMHSLRIEAARRGERFDAFMRKLLNAIVHPNENRPNETLFAQIIDDGK